MEETVKTFRDMDTESLIMRLKRNIYHRVMTLNNIDALSQKQGNLVKAIERKKMALEQQIASMETYRDERYEYLNRVKLQKGMAVKGYDDVIRAYRSELISRGLTEEELNYSFDELIG